MLLLLMQVNDGLFHKMIMFASNFC